MTERSREQTLIDIMFEVALMIQSNKTLQKASREELTDWVRRQMIGCGFDVSDPIGSSWGVLK